MKSYILSLLLVLLAVYSPCNALTNTQTSTRSEFFWLEKLLKPIGGFGPGFKCFGCTLIVHAIEQYTEANELNIDDFIMNDFCNLFPTEFQASCKTLINQYGPELIAALLNSSSPDAACRAIKLCDNPQCNLFPKELIPKVTLSPNWPFYIEKYCPVQDESPLNWLNDLVANKLSSNTPTFDVDGDYHSATYAELRGYNWRGRDCNDLDPNVHPGRKTNPYPGSSSDFNCNGISGADNNGKEYEKTFCENSGALGVVVMGDSAGAHCEIPAQWMNGTAWNQTMFTDLLTVIFNEVDLPQFSGFTGFYDQGYTGPVRSLYKNLYERNKCNFRDYLNIAVNGASSGDSLGNIQVLNRNPETDNPLLMVLELIGNDVCDYHNSFDVMTTPEEFRVNILKILDYLDTAVPAGSHLVILGLVNGSLIFEGVKNHTHPSGVSYSQFYDYQNCLEASFCWGWLNTNDTVRELTTQRAMELNQVYQDILTNYTAKNYDIIYYDFPAQPIWDQWIADGNDPYGLIEPADGFHPNQMFHALLSDYLWNALSQDRPEWLGPENSNNDQITQLFGDQGGY